MAYRGTFVPKNKEKYRGDWSKITYRSSWELFFMNWLDNNQYVSQWNSECVVIPYYSRADQKKRRYFMDFWFRDTQFKEYFIEVKPKKETIAPTKPVKLTVHSKKRYMNELYTYCVNTDKWKAAKAAADKGNITFKILTEDGLRQMGFKGAKE